MLRQDFAIGVGRSGRGLVVVDEATSPSSHRFERTRNLVHYPKVKSEMSISALFELGIRVSNISRLGDSPGSY